MVESMRLVTEQGSWGRRKAPGVLEAKMVEAFRG